MRFPWLLSMLVVEFSSCLVGQSDRIGRLVMPSAPVTNSTPARLFMLEASPPPLITQGAGTR
jgi:hypothetical protein